ncbi:MAG: hypothetical protein ACD_47C00140G0005 [uncultured bacterium]|nr:MAG: hypothetical protein ACD_47C00140G0005 [uncultured bacterium]
MFWMFLRPISERSQVVAVTHSGFMPSCSILITCVVLSLPPLTGTMQSQREESALLYLSSNFFSSSMRRSQFTSFLFSKLLQALHTPSSSRKRSGLVSGMTHLVQ